MESVCLTQGFGLCALLIHTVTGAGAGVIEYAPKIDGRHRAALTLKENVTRKFNCQSEGWNSQAPPLLTWYLNGERQRPGSEKRAPGRLVNTPQEQGGRLKPVSKHNSTFSLRARKWDRELVCAVSGPHTGESYNATVTLDVQFQPEILRVNAQYSETSDPGLSLVLFALVRSNPPAQITWVDQSGQLVANTSDFLTLDSRNYPWLTNHTLRVTLNNLSGNVSVNASNSIGVAQSSVTLARLTEFLQSRVEVSVLGILTGGAVGFISLLILSLVVLCLLHKNKAKAVDEPVEIIMQKKRIESPIVDKMPLPRENMSLPSNIQLNDLNTLRKAREAARHLAEVRGEEEEDEDLSAAYAARGFARYPMIGYIYKVNSVSSDEIWL